MCPACCVVGMDCVLRRGTVNCGYVSCAAAFGESECSNVNQQCRLSGLQPTAPACATSRLKNGAGHPLRFIDLHRQVLIFRTSARPFRRCLVFQARFAAKQALAEGPLQRAAAGRDGTLPGGSEPAGIQYRGQGGMLWDTADVQCRHGHPVQI